MTLLQHLIYTAREDARGGGEWASPRHGSGNESSATHQPLKLVCSRTSSAYTPWGSFISSEWVPCSTTCPPTKTHILSDDAIVLSLWAMPITVRQTMTRSKASCTADSLSLSRALVASSSSSILGSCISALAIAILCFCPPDSLVPLSPTVLATSRNDRVLGTPYRGDTASSSSDAAFFAGDGLIATYPSAFVLYTMFSKMVPEKSTG